MKLSPSLITRLVFACVAIVLTGCSTTNSANNEHSDPLEPVNRAIWTFNWDYADKYVLKPASKTYVTYVPQPLRKGIYNVVLNINEPFSAVNSLLQLKVNRAAQTTGRFVLNSTVGLLGFFDVASYAGLTREEEEFGEVLGYYGVEDGPYLMLPLFGPSSVRDGTGDLVDSIYWPLAVIDFWPNVARYMVIGLETRAQLEDQEALLNDSVDPYEFVKQVYFQNIEYRLYDGNPPLVIDEEEEAELDEDLDDLLEDL
ncbi:MlaA family lipoprotein [Thalassotalea mangrovi]|uniref:VacJ family lipoprotein n=1 Tax=Thalassotalea mangrovi TaxID=2572245 RepID=A0A4U1B572_9GAMM|nr:VacJ family lipoprotein [Thalassotalea mangrovi]TKB45158.1 VacJ family lipoprotein [Thalassotalea mangrovi]